MATPKRADLSVHTEADFYRIPEVMNSRPRQTLTWMRPSEVLVNVDGMRDVDDSI